MSEPTERTAHLVVGGGCFWCLEAVFERLRGVHAVASGYAGGARPHPSYAQVCSGATGHAEVIRVSFDPGVVSVRELLELFFAFHDPTTRDRQGPDIGSQYRSIIVAADEAQAAVAREVIATLEADRVFGAPIVTELRVGDPFWPAEPEHAQYYRRNPGQAYCQAMIAPKVAKLRKAYADRLNPEFA
jgi:peptide-methionine (S)-S-oxide reductase